MKELHSRRSFLATSAKVGAIGAAALAGIEGPFAYAMARSAANVKGITITSISRMRIPRFAGIVVKIETNKGIIGYGECRDLDDQAQQWLEKLSPLVVGMNPTQIEDIFNVMAKAWSVAPDMVYNQERMGTGAISGIEMACWDIMGKAQKVPVYKLLGKRLLDKIPMYADTDSNRKEDVEGRVAKGFKHYKCDMYLSNIARGNYTTSEATNKYGYREITISPAGLDQMRAYMGAYRETLKSFGEPYASAPIGSDHYQGYNARNQISVASAIALANALRENNPKGYVEDIIDWWIDGCSGKPSKEVADATEMKVQTGEDMFGFNQFKPWADIKALDHFHPEPNTFGGLNQTLIASKYAHDKGIVTYHHNSSGPIAMTAYAHLAAVTPSFVAMEFHQMDHPWHDELVDGVDKPMIKDGFTSVPETPGLGVSPNEAQFAAHGATGWTKIV